MSSLSQQTQEIQMFLHMYPQVDMIKDADEVHRIYTELIDCLVDHNHLYYIKNTSIISDKEYDDLFAYLKKIEELHPEIISSNSPTQGLVGQVSEGFEQAKHTDKLYSLENTYNAQDIQERDERIKKIIEKDHVGTQHFASDSKISYTIEPKFDGLGIELIYKNGNFVQAITRGDGRVGEDITVNAKTIKNIPRKLHKQIDIEVRGEIIMPKSIRNEINKEREEE